MDAGIPPLPPALVSGTMPSHQARETETHAIGPAPHVGGHGARPGRTEGGNEAGRVSDAEPETPEGVASASVRRRPIGMPKVRPGRGRGGHAAWRG
jgi:hypothetical protein